MTTAELQAQISAMRESIQAQQERLDELEKQLESTDELDEIDKPLEIKDDEAIYCLSDTGCIIRMFGRTTSVPFMNVLHRVFKSEKYAAMYSEKTQFIADLLHFKWLYDRDFEPDWDNPSEDKYTVWYCPDEKNFLIDITSSQYVATVYFSTAKLARKCADWLNRKAGRNE